MRPALRFLRAETLDFYRRILAHPLGIALSLFSLPAMLAVYGLVGGDVAGGLLRAHGEGGVPAFAGSVRTLMMAFAGIVTVMSAAAEVGTLLAESSRRSLERCRRLPLSDPMVYAIRKALGEGQMFAILVPVVAVVAWQLMGAGLPAGVVASLCAAPFLVMAWCLTAVRLVVLGVVSLLPAPRIGWRSALWLLIGGIVLAAGPAAELARGWSPGRTTASFFATDWAGDLVEDAFAGRAGSAWARLGLAGVAAVVALAVDFAAFRAVLLRGFDQVGSRLAAAGGRGPRLLARLLDAVPARVAGVRARAWVRKETLRIAADPVLALALQIPLLTLTLAFAVVDVLLAERGLRIAVPGAIGSLAGVLGLAGVVLPALLVPWEGPGLGAVRAAPAAERDIFAGKAFTGFLFATAAWEVGWLCAASLTGPLLGSPLLTWAAIPAAIPFAAAITAVSGTALGCLFPNHRSANPLFALQLVGLGLHWLFALLALGSIAALLAAVARFGPAYLLFVPAIAVPWLAVVLLLRALAGRALRRARTG